jgi:Rha family phage regulatory protein
VSPHFVPPLPRPQRGFFSGPEFANRVDSYSPNWQNVHARDNNPPCGCEPPARPRDDSSGRVFLRALRCAELASFRSPKPTRCSTGSRRQPATFAEHFEKQHGHVLRDIEAIELGPDLERVWFRPSSYVDATGRTLPSFNLTRQGFTLLAMGWTGERAENLGQPIFFFQVLRRKSKVTTNSSKRPKFAAIIFALQPAR